MGHRDTIPGVLLATAVDHRDVPALVGPDGGLTYAELADVALRVAAGLVDLGLAPGDRVGIWAPNSPAWAVASHAVHLAAGVVVPLDTRTPVAGIDELLARCPCRVVIAADEFLGVRMADAVAGLGRTETVVRVRPGGGGAAGSGGTVVWDDLVSFRGRTGHAAVTDRVAELTPDTISHVQLTSGTTGRPKGVLLRHGAMVRTTRAWVEVVGLRAGDRYPVTSPCSHIGGHKTGLLAAAIAGATVVPYPLVDVARLADELATGDLGLLQGPPAMFATLLREVERRGATGSVRAAVTGAAVVPPEIVEAIRGRLGARAVHTAYGISEATGVCTITRVDDPPEVVAGTAGRPIPGVRLRVVDPDGRDLPYGEVGELLVTGDGLMAGYLDDPVATAAAVQDGWLRTGDLAVVTERGDLRIVDRLKDLVIVGGFNVYPAQVERVLESHPSVREAAVIGRPDDRLGEVPHAYVVPEQGGVDVDAVLAWCRERLANTKVPRSVTVVASLPRNTAGKLDKPSLRQAVSPPGPSPSG